MPATVILNPYANRWEAEKQIPEVERSLRAAGIDFKLQVTERPEHGIELARAAAEAGNFPIIAAGGDGSLSEVVNGLLQATPPGALPAGPIGFIPLGTANDLTDMLEIPRDLDEVARMLAAGHIKIMDVGTVNQRYFDNNSAIGLEPVVSLENIRLTWLKGVLRYFVSAVLAIMKRPTWKAELEWDDGTFTGEIALVSVGNSRRTGGVFFMTPNASLFDGKLDFVFAPALGRLRLFQLLPKTQTGEHIHELEIHEHRTTKLTIRTQTPTPIQADGEVFETAATEITYQIIPGALKVILPAP